VTLQELANYAEIIGTLIVIGGIAFGLFQLFEIRKQRRDIVAGELMRTFYNVELADAVALIRTLPDHCPPAELRQRGAQYERAAIIVSTTFETMGLLVFKRIADYETVQQLAGGLVVVVWRKLDAWLAQVRTEQVQPSWAEWFQWLAEQSAARKDESRPAYIEYKDWNP
jgi:hypothetical protein